MFIMLIVIFIPKACDMYAVRTYFIIKLTFEQRLDYFSGTVSRVILKTGVITQTIFLLRFIVRTNQPQNLFLGFGNDPLISVNLFPPSI